MVFNSFAFAVFFAIVLLAYYSLRWRSQNLLLLVASYFFYGWWDARFTILLAVSTIVDYVAAIRIADSCNPRVRRIALGVSVCTNFGILGFFKYFNFFSDSAARLLSAFGLGASWPTLQIVLPVGISFYTFQTLSYTIDVYRGQLEPTRAFTTFALYVSFFPQLVAGPIERASRLLPQLGRRRHVSVTDVEAGVLLILLGFFKKVGIADVAGMLCDVVYRYPERMSAMTLLLGVYLFSIQIYCDFSGYTDIARGVARLLGIKLMRNFEQPYFSVSITEFWRRWHISLSSWLRDYLYIPLGGNRRGNVRTYFNLMTTMLLGGLWHGASWTFVVWGGLHGVYLSAHKFLRGKDREERPASRLSMCLACFLTFHLVAFTWVFFRNTSFTGAVRYVTGILVWRNGKEWIGEFDVVRVGVPVLVLVALEWFQNRSGSHTVLLEVAPVVRGVVYGTLIVMIFLFGAGDGETPFIYFQF